MTNSETKPTQKHGGNHSQNGNTTDRTTTKKFQKPHRADRNKFSDTCVDVLTASEEKIIWAWNNNVPLTGIHTIGTHPSPHMDEKAAMVALCETAKGRRLFPDIENAKVAVVTQTALSKMKGVGFAGFIRALRSGILLLGVGNGPLDEHQNRAEKISCLELVIRHLDLFAEKNMRTVFYDILKWINYEDNNGDNLLSAAIKANTAAQVRMKGSLELVAPEEIKLCRELTEVLQTMQPGMVASIIKKGYETIDQTNDAAFMNVFMTGYNMIAFPVRQGLKFLEANEEYDTMKETIKANAVPISADGKYRLLIVESDNPLMAKAVRRKNPDSNDKKVGILLIAKKTGKPATDNPELVGRHFALMPSPEFKDSMSDILKVLQQTIYKNCEGKFMNFDKIGKYGYTEEIPELYFDENQRIIMNGSKTDPDVEGLLDVELDIETIVDAVTTVTLKQFEPYHAKKCAKGHCSKTGDGKFCALFASCLSHCKAVQATTKPAQPQQKGEHSKDGKPFNKGNNQHRENGKGNHHKGTGSNNQDTKQQPVKRN